MDYLPAIQFAAALNLGYILPNILKRMYGVLENINVSYLGILADVKSRTTVKINELCNIHIIETKEDDSTRPAIEQLKGQVNTIAKDCEENEKKIKSIIDEFIDCSGYRSIFFYSAIYSIFALLAIPFCHQHPGLWAVKWFFFVFTILSLLYIIVLFIVVITRKSDISCRGVLWWFIMFAIISAIAAYVNVILPPLIQVSSEFATIISWFSIIISFLPGTGCAVFVSCLILCSIVMAKSYRRGANKQLEQINSYTEKLDEFNKILKGEISLK